MILAIDIGNSFTKWKAWEGERIFGSGKFANKHGMSQLFKQLDGVNPSSIAFADVCDTGFEGELAGIFPDTRITQVNSTRSAFGVTNCYPVAESLGIDRWLASIEAYQLSKPQPCCVLDFGTAATLDVVDAEGNHTGGQIVPGLRMLRNTLPKYTGKVRFEAENEFLTGYGSNTVEAVERGSLSMLIAWAQHEIQLFMQNNPQGKVFITGGTAAFLIAYLPESVIRHDDLVLDALRRFAVLSG